MVHVIHRENGQTVASLNVEGTFAGVLMDYLNRGTVLEARPESYILHFDKEPGVTVQVFR